MNNTCSVVITTINEKTVGIEKYLQKKECGVILIGDKKSKYIESSNNTLFLSVQEQMKLGFDIIKKCPFNHYARKNIGYLIAMQSGANVIYDTDDDNVPLDNWTIPDFVSTLLLKSDEQYLNIYNYFTDKKVWPRGLPLNQINSNNNLVLETTESQNVAVWQGMANGDPDVDAVYRLVDNEAVTFNYQPGVFLNKGVYCPFNSQNTFWKKEFFPLLYLPSTTSFRFTDILRGYIAQRLIWDCDHYLGFMKATVFQDRNQHDYMRDFEDEVEVYLNVEKVVKLLSTIKLKGSLTDKLLTVYKELRDLDIVKNEEIGILDAWISDYKNVQ